MNYCLTSALKLISSSIAQFGTSAHMAAITMLNAVAGLFIRVSILKRNKMQELKQIKLTDAVGKKIAGVKVGYEKHIIKYEDGTFTFFERWEEWF